MRLGICDINNLSSSQQDTERYSVFELQTVQTCLSADIIYTGIYRYHRMVASEVKY